IALAILTALALMCSQFVTAAPALAAKACCGKCGGQCCVKDSSAPLAPKPVAPAPAQGAPNVELLLAVASALEIPSVRFSAPPSVCPAPVFTATRPLFQRNCVYLI